LYLDRMQFISWVQQIEQILIILYLGKLNKLKETLWDICNTSMMFRKFKDYKDYVNEKTTDYKFILFDNTAQSKNGKDRMKVVKTMLYKGLKLRCMK